MTCCNNKWSSSGLIKNAHVQNPFAQNNSSTLSVDNNYESPFNFIGLLNQFDEAYNDTMKKDFFVLSGIKNPAPKENFHEPEPTFLDKATSFIKKTFNNFTDSKTTELNKNNTNQPLVNLFQV